MKREKRGSSYYRKSALKRLEEQWEGEGVFDPSKEPEITPLLRSVDGGIAQIMAALRCSDSEDAKCFMELYDSLSQHDRKALSLEEIAYGCGIGSLRLAEVAQTAMFLYAQRTTKFLIAGAMPNVMRSTIKAATDEMPILDGQGNTVGKTNGDIRAMEMFHKMAGTMPLPKGTQIAIQNNVSNPDDDKVKEAEPVWLDPGDRLRMIHEAVDPKRLPSPATPHLEINAKITHMQDDVAEVISGDV
ncbi:MAG: hypothetical protein KGL39_19260 [Patescibacteria group bacterium]|nr:hypothetical protein [Patescibacteria group bacterium]